MIAGLLAVVLAGGEGRRMGGGKPLRRFGETTLADHAVRRARSYASVVAVAVREPGQVAGAVDAPLLVDDPAIEGPLAGLQSALRHGQSLGAAFVLTLPCDSPRLPSDLAARLHAALADGGAVAVAQSASNLHPVCALWRTEAIERLPAYLASGRRSLKGFATAVGLTAVSWSDAAGDPFVNANTPFELDALQPDRGCPVAVP